MSERRRPGGDCAAQGDEPADPIRTIRCRPSTPITSSGRGTWSDDAPETPLAPEGVHTGTLTFTHVDGCYYEGELKAKGPKGVPYTSRIQMMYDPAGKYLTWIETDSRGYTLFKPGTMGADSGGYFTHYFETQGFKPSKTGPELHVKGSTFVASPTNFRIRRSLSVAGDPYMNIGEMWFRKH